MNNPFIQALGIAALCYITLQGLSIIARSLAMILQSFSFWVQAYLVPHSWQVAIAIGVLYLLYVAVTTSRRGI
jgi:hypothetical protein